MTDPEERMEVLINAAKTLCANAREEEFYDGYQAPWRPTVVDGDDLKALRDALASYEGT